jgi:hypothetical protein
MYPLKQSQTHKTAYELISGACFSLNIWLKINDMHVSFYNLFLRKRKIFSSKEKYAVKLGKLKKCYR